MKKTILTLIISLLTTYSLAETGKFNASGDGTWTMNVMNAGNGNMSITYDGNAGLADKEPGSIFDKSTMHCIGGLTLVAGKFDDETGMCTFYLMDGEKVFINYKGKGTGGQGGSGDFVIVGGTGKYENISGTGFSSRQNLKGKAGMAHSLNQMSGNYTY
mgnify:CR=1 FL=1